MPGFGFVPPYGYACGSQEIQLELPIGLAHTPPVGTLYVVPEAPSVRAVLLTPAGAEAVVPKLARVKVAAEAKAEDIPRRTATELKGFKHLEENLRCTYFKPDSSSPCDDIPGKRLDITGSRTAGPNAADELTKCESLPLWGA